MIYTLPPFTYHYTCPKCAFTRSVPGAGQGQPVTKFCTGRYHSGRPRAEGEGDGAPDQVCKYGDGEHVHLRCPSCSYEAALNTAEATGVVQRLLTVEEIGGPQG